MSGGYLIASSAIHQSILLKTVTEGPRLALSRLTARLSAQNKERPELLAVRVNPGAPSSFSWSRSHACSTTSVKSFSGFGTRIDPHQ
ncbi:hypothetical protein FAIPA1_10515 [Frankia sp. AiPs1]